MKAFDLHKSVLEQYKKYLLSFITIKDERIKERVKEAIENDEFILQPLLQFNPAYESHGSLEEFVGKEGLHPDLVKCFKGYSLFRHQVEAIRHGAKQKDFIVTSGTGSGKSLTFIATVFNHILQNNTSQKGIQAIIVYPMNALINSQEVEIKKYAINYLKSFLKDGEVVDEKDKTPDEIIDLLNKKTGQSFPISYNKYTGQEDADTRERIKNNPPNIILTNYMMLELIMTRHAEAWFRNLIKDNLQFLVFDELHTYRGRQGSDVSYLIRRIHNLSQNDLICIGTSATLSSEGTLAARKEAVATVASTIFGKTIEPDQIINETLQRSTTWNGQMPAREALIDAVNKPVKQGISLEAIKSNPLAVWLENNVALNIHPDGFIERGKPVTLEKVTQMLCNETGLETAACFSALISLLAAAEDLNKRLAETNSRTSFLPLKIHQFISQTNVVYVSLDKPGEREIMVKAGRYYLDEEGKSQFIYPVLFSRMSGHEFICVQKDFETGTLIPRDPDDLPEHLTKEDMKGKTLSMEDFSSGYLIIPHEGDDELWNESMIEELPQSWWKVKGDKPVLDKHYQYRVPSKIYFDNVGNFSESPQYEMWGWFMPAKLLFDPTAGIIYDLRTGENTKLMRLGNEGRSTATTLLSFSVIRAMAAYHEKVHDQKVLSFTDNLQDASLQSGHFNDFITTGRLRSALYHALINKPDQMAKAYELGDLVFKTLNLREEEYALNPNADFPDPENERAEKDYLLTRILYDLRWGWRFNLPNLEQCALLSISYDRLDEFVKMDKFFEHLPLFETLVPEARYSILENIMNFFRTSYALDYPLLTINKELTESFFESRLDPDKLWSPDKNERIEFPNYLTTRNPGQTPKGIYTASIGPHSYLGKYFKRVFKDHGLDPLKGDDYIEFIEAVCEVLKKANLIVIEQLAVVSGTPVNGYRLRVNNIIWKPGDGVNVRIDEVRWHTYKNLILKPNDYFRGFYQLDFSSFEKPLIGREHTGSIKREQRIYREEAFRKGEISAMFCTPTMELGVDIASLNVVHMRNVPPNPANYVQRGGRAGRSGQAALVFTYCSQGSPHDQNYFKRPETMVAGALVPPRIDLQNEELVLTHLNAFLLMHVGLSELKISVADVIDQANKAELSLKGHVRDFIQHQINQFGQLWLDEFIEIIKPLIPMLKETNWFSEEWILKNVNTFEIRFDKAFDRWRLLFKAAESAIQKARITMDNPSVKQNSPEMLQAKRMHNTGLRQRALLLNESSDKWGNESEFYVFRYLAAEGFLPGYNFTRLPIRAFMGYKHQDEGEYVSRARFIALREYGPGNLVYYNGNKYKINRALLTEGELRLRKIKVALGTGYAFMDEDVDQNNNDPITKADLNDRDNYDLLANAFELTESEANPQERISCEEEERMSMGFVIDQFFNYEKGIGSTRQAVIQSGTQPLLNVIYGPSTRLVQVNQRWKRSKDSDGFYIDDRNGRWLREKEREKPDTAAHAKLIKLFTSNTADTLYIQPVKDLGLNEDQVISLAYALKRGIESMYQVEENEIGVWVMGKKETPNIMIYEAAEGSLGILSEIIANPAKMQSLFRESYRLMHFDPETHENLRPDLPKASYEDLLSYYNQRHHGQLDRFGIQDALKKLMECHVDTKQGTRTREEQYQYLLSLYDKSSSTERSFIDHLYKNGYVLPDEAQKNIRYCYVNADFIFKTETGPVIIFCDGSVHDDWQVKEEDKTKRQCLHNHGYDVITWHYKTPIEEIIENRKDVFRKIM